MASRRAAILICGLSLAFAMGASAAAAPAPATSERDWTVEDSIAIRYFTLYNSAAGTPPGWIRSPGAQDLVAVPSPDGRRFFSTTLRGNLATDEIDYEMSIYSVDDIARQFRSPAAGTGVMAPARILKFSSGYSDDFESAGVSDSRWETDSTVLFVGVTGKGPHRLYRYNVESGHLQALSAEGHDLMTGTGWNVVRGHGAIYATREWEPWKPLDRYPMATIRNDDLAQMLDPRRVTYKWWARYAEGEAHAIALQSQGTGLYGPWMSPDGKWALAVLAQKGESVPDSWRKYERAPQLRYQYVLIDLERGVSRPLFDAPAGIAVEAGRRQRPAYAAFWSFDSRRVALTNTTLPLTEEHPERTRMSYVIEYDVGHDRWSGLEPSVLNDGSRITSTRWVREGVQFLVSREGKAPAQSRATLYTYGAGTWKGRDVPAGKYPATVLQPGFAHGIGVRLKEGPVEPPVLVAVKGNRQISLTSPDYAADGVWRSQPGNFEVRDEAGRTARGGLLLPRAKAGDRLPLVIQAVDGSYEAHAFRPDGQFVSGFAAQALVAQGFVVLNLEFLPDQDDTRFTPKEGLTRVQWIDAAVEELSRRGLIDPTRVGLVGFSRSGYLTYYILTHPGRTRLRAGIVFDSITSGYGEYVIQRALGETGASSYEQQYGVGTFWQNKAGWMDAPPFNVEKVAAPVLFAATGVGTKWGALETIGAFRYTKRPIEYLYFGQGSHVLQKPLERQAAMQSTVDWMNFWLQDRENSRGDPERLERWRRMQIDWERTRASEGAVPAAGSSH